MSSPAHRAPEQAGTNGHLSVVAQALEERLASAKLREVVAADLKTFGAISSEARGQAEHEWEAGKLS